MLFTVLLIKWSNKANIVDSVNKNVGATIRHSECKKAYLKNKCMRHLINRIQCENHRKGTYQFSKSSLSYFDDKEVFCQATKILVLFLVL